MPCRLEDVENRKQEDPNDIDEMPVQPGALQKSVAMRRDISSERPNQSRYQHQDADENMAAVESGQNKKAGAHDPCRIKPKALIMEGDPLNRLIREKCRPQEDRQHEQKLSTLGLPD